MPRMLYLLLLFSPASGLWCCSLLEDGERGAHGSIARQTAGSGVQHFVRAGDTLSGLAQRYDTGLEDLRARNGGQELIQVGQILELVPGPRFWKFREASHFLGMAPPARGFDFPVGGREAEGYYSAQGFGENLHLGEDWNGVGGGDSDLGDPVRAIADGVVFYADDAGTGWGQVVRLVHNAGSNTAPRYVESLYGHLHAVEVRVGQLVLRGQSLGSIGTANGRYLAHLHLEVRDRLDMGIGPGYAQKSEGYLQPTGFIRENRPARQGGGPRPGAASSALRVPGRQ